MSDLHFKNKISEADLQLLYANFSQLAERGRRMFRNLAIIGILFSIVFWFYFLPGLFFSVPFVLIAFYFQRNKAKFIISEARILKKEHLQTELNHEALQSYEKTKTDALDLYVLHTEILKSYNPELSEIRDLKTMNGTKTFFINDQVYRDIKPGDIYGFILGNRNELIGLMDSEGIKYFYMSPESEKSVVSSITQYDYRTLPETFKIIEAESI